MANSPSDNDAKLPPNVFLVLDKHLLPITQDTLFLGRHPDNDLIINDPRVSRKHAQIRFQDNEFVLYDLGAKHGTFVNGQRIKQHTLQSGDTFSLANTPILFIDRSSIIVQRAKDATSTLEE